MVPIVVISAESDRETMIECLRAGADDFLQKPFAKEEFHARVRNLLRLKGLRDELIRKNRALEDLAYHDSLTGLFNRAYFDGCLEREIDRARRSREPLGFLLMDLDHFKKVNDAHGHETGDEVLRQVASIVRRNVRGYDIPCRVGGEELCVILPRATTAAVVSVAERIRRACAAERITSKGISQTASIGISVFPETSDGGALFADADAALYRAKASGRNRTLVASAAYRADRAAS
jgi:two-component system cell cycle response regulator